MSGRFGTGWAICFHQPALPAAVYLICDLNKSVTFSSEVVACGCVIGRPVRLGAALIATRTPAQAHPATQSRRRQPTLRLFTARRSRRRNGPPSQGQPWSQARNTNTLSPLPGLSRRWKTNGLAESGFLGTQVRERAPLKRLFRCSIGSDDSLLRTRAFLRCDSSTQAHACGSERRLTTKQPSQQLGQGTAAGRRSESVSGADGRGGPSLRATRRRGSIRSIRSIQTLARWSGL